MQRRQLTQRFGQPTALVNTMMSCPAGEQRIALVVSPVEGEHHAVAVALIPEGWRVRSVTSCAAALRFLKTHETRIVIAECELPDGNWHTILSGLREIADPPKLIVTSRLADDRLWAEVLNLGGADVLAQPFCPSEVWRSVCLACRHWQQERRNKTSCT
jgi:DNA-binding response OmpR family regulator